MADDILAGLDESFARARREGPPRRGRRVAVPNILDGMAARARASRGTRLFRVLDENWWMRTFLAAQFLWGIFLFVPGAQSFRGYVRALPYATSLGLLGLFFLYPAHGSRPKGTGFLLCALALLAVNLLHPTSQLSAGLAQCVFQLAIAAPAFFAFKTVRSTKALESYLVLIFAMNALSAALGVLQVYYPEEFMPPQLNSLGIQLNEYYVESLTYIGREGRRIIRPPGLTDQPGGAALAGGLTALLGLALSLRARNLSSKVLTLSLAVIGLAAVYLTQVRSVLLMIVAGVGVLSVVAIRQRRRGAAAFLAVAGGFLIVSSFIWATTLGGESLGNRFLDIGSQGALQTYQQNRGGFLAYTLGELLDEFPLGAGVGRWGMMNTYFGDPGAFRSTPIHVEIQLTGWLLDGGWPMWVFYGGAIVSSIIAGVRLATWRNERIADAALMVVTLQVFIAGLAMAGPIFNTQMGILFWTVAAALQGAATLREPEVNGVVTAGYERR